MSVWINHFASCMPLYSLHLTLFLTFLFNSALWATVFVCVYFIIDIIAMFIIVRVLYAVSWFSESPCWILPSLSLFVLTHLHHTLNHPLYWFNSFAYGTCLLQDTHKEQHMLILHLHCFVFLYLFGVILKTWIPVSYEEWAPVWGNEDASGPTLNLHQVANLFGWSIFLIF